MLVSFLETHQTGLLIRALTYMVPLVRPAVEVALEIVVDYFSDFRHAEAESGVLSVDVASLGVEGLWVV